MNRSVEPLLAAVRTGLFRLPDRRTAQAALVCIALSSAGGHAPPAEECEPTAAQLRRCEIQIPDAINRAENANNIAISVGIKMRGGHTLVCVRTAVPEPLSPSDQAAFFRHTVNAHSRVWAPQTQVITAPADVARTASELSALRASKYCLLEILELARCIEPGEVYAITPTRKDGHPVFRVKVATPGGKTKAFTLDPETAERVD